MATNEQLLEFFEHPPKEITDTERLDFYSKNSSAFKIEASGSVFSLWTEVRLFFPTLRGAIDAAMKETKK